MASISIMVSGAIINATAFVGGRYLAKYLMGDRIRADKERKCHDLVVEEHFGGLLDVPRELNKASRLDRDERQSQGAGCSESH